MPSPTPVLLIASNEITFSSWYQEYFGHALHADNPNLTHLNEDATGIKIDDVRNLQTLLSYSSGTQQRVVVLHGFESTQPTAQNALLKLLEEPPENTQLILIAKSSENVLPTISSRCLTVYAATDTLEHPTGSPFTPQDLLEKISNSTEGELLSLSDQFGERQEAIASLEALLTHLHHQLQSAPSKNLTSQIAVVQTAIRDLKGNINQKLALDHCWIEIKKNNPG